MADKKRGLGRGLDQLLSSGDWLKRDDVQLFYCPVDQLTPNPFQPRQVVQDDAMEELVRSVSEKGILQPILALRTDTPNHYQILAGERRWRAARKAGLPQVPVLLRESTPAEVLEIALIENIQRQDLNCIEEALAYQRLQEEFHLTQENIAQRVGKKRSTVANLLRLLHLPQDIQEDVLNGRLTMGHARALLSLPTADQQRKLRNAVVQRHLSVRQTEELAHRPESTPSPPKVSMDPFALRCQETLQARLQTKVSVRKRGHGGTITIAFKSQEEFQRLVQDLGGDASREH